VGDFSGDGYPDLAVVNADVFSDGSVTILYNNKSGGFPETTTGSAAGDVETVSVGTNPVSIAVGDFNGDGRLDAVMMDADAGIIIFTGRP